ncbi:MAG: chromate resistance protein [Thermoanaerobaculia bacterium]
MSGGRKRLSRSRAAAVEPRRWLILLLQLPARPDYLRVRVARLLSALGAVALKNGVHALPAAPAARERLDWLAAEIAPEGGELTLVEGGLVDPRAEEELVGRFRARGESDWNAIRDEALALATASDGGASSRRAWNRLEERRRRVAEIDFFAAAGRAEAESALAALAALAESPAPGAAAATGVDLAALRGRVWVTRPGVREDRIASAWLVRRFIDPRARFRFSGAAGRRRAAELRFDMAGGDFTHEGGRCTMEVLLDRLRIDDPAARALAEIVHDVDLGDDRFGRDETAGFAAAIRGLAATEPDDRRRLERGFALLDALYAALSPDRPRPARRR